MFNTGADKENADRNFNKSIGVAESRRPRSLSEEDIKVSYAKLLGKEPKKYKSKVLKNF